MSASIGDGFPMNAGVLGYYASASYSHGAGSHQEGTRADPRNVTRSDYSRATIGTAADGYLVLGYEADAGWNLYSRTLLLRRTEDTAESESGFDIDDAKIGRLREGTDTTGEVASGTCTTDDTGPLLIVLVNDDGVENPAIDVLIEHFADQSEIARYDLSEDASVETAMIFGEVYRHNGDLDLMPASNQKLVTAAAALHAASAVGLRCRMATGRPRPSSAPCGPAA